jgi:hypothetical protein
VEVGGVGWKAEWVSKSKQIFAQLSGRVPGLLPLSLPKSGSAILSLNTELLKKKKKKEIY